MFDMERVVGEWVNMWNRYDLSQVDGLFLDSDDLSYFSSDREGIIKGLVAVREHHRRFGFVPGGKKHGNKLWETPVGTVHLRLCQTGRAVSPGPRPLRQVRR
jgi:hypothetical protein